MTQAGEFNGVEYYVGSGNVFADLGLSNPEERRLKAHLSIAIEDAIRSKRLTKKQAAQKLGLDRHNLAELLEGALDAYSIDQLTQYLHSLGRAVELSVSVRESEPDTKKRAPKKAREAVAA